MAFGSRFQEWSGGFRFARRFVVQADIQLSVEPLSRDSRGVRSLFRGIQYVVRSCFATVQIVDFHHRDSAVVTDRQQIFLRGLYVFRFGDTEKSPDGILYIIVVVGLIEFELVSATLVLASVVHRDPSFPLPRFAGLVLLNVFIEVGHRFHDLAQAKQGSTSPVVGVVRTVRLVDRFVQQLFRCPVFFTRCGFAGANQKIRCRRVFGMQAAEHANEE